MDDHNNIDLYSQTFCSLENTFTFAMIHSSQTYEVLTMCKAPCHMLGTQVVKKNKLFLWGDYNYKLEWGKKGNNLFNKSYGSYDNYDECIEYSGS